MKISLNWIKEYVAFGTTSQKLAHKLTMAGFEVEKIEHVKGDVVFELEITPNRPDCLSMLGLAREISAILDKVRKGPILKKSGWPKKKCDISIQDKNGCLKYVGIVLRDVDVKDSPQNIVQKLQAIGLRGINNVVDITNFCLMETGQPLHAFDYDKLIGGKIIVRRAKKGEKIITIDDVERDLDPSILVIADAKRPVAIAGIMGGKDTEVTRATKNILLESAYFDSVLIRQGSRKIGLTSDSSYRFERGVDFSMVEGGAQRAFSLLVEHTKGNPEKSSDVIVQKNNHSQKTIQVSSGFVNDYLGTSFSPSKFKNILKKLDFQIASGKGQMLRVRVPSFREDVKEDVDVVEEISRIVGYDNLPASLPQIHMSGVSPGRKRVKRQEVQAYFVGQGFNEVITYTMINRKMLEMSLQGSLQGTPIKNPLTVDQEMMRPSLLPSLLNVVKFNINRGQKDLKLFEMGKIYLYNREQETLGIIMTGTLLQDWRLLSNRNIEFYDIKGVAEQLLDRLAISGVKVESGNHIYLSEGQAASFYVDEKEIGVVGKINEDVLTNWEIKSTDFFYAQIALDPILVSSGTKKAFQTVSEYPFVSRDISLAVKKDIQFKFIEEVVRQCASDILTGVMLKEQYLGDKIAKDSKGLIVSLSFQSAERTLKEEEVNVVQENIVKALVERLGAIIR